jgi:hypothetical protein
MPCARPVQAADADLVISKLSGECFEESGAPFVRDRGGDAR